MAIWRDELSDDLFDRVMLPDEVLVGGDDDEEWDGAIGERENHLRSELERYWLWKREELITAGLTDPGALRVRCNEWQREWERRKHKSFGKPPATVIRAERRRTRLT